MVKYLKSAKIDNKSILLRVDVNEPIADNKVSDDFRIQQIIPTVQNLINRGCKVVVASHLGRPDGKYDKVFSMRPVAQRIADLLGRKFIETDRDLPNYPVGHLIFFTGDIQNDQVRRKIQAIPQKEVVFLENLRFYKGELENSDFFAEQLSELADIYVNDAFSVCHHPAASIVAVAGRMEHYAGFVVEREIKALSMILNKPQSPFVLIMGGMKISEKEKTLTFLGQRTDSILLAGGLANLILMSQGISIGQTSVQEDGLSVAKQLYQNFKDKIILPRDVVVANAAMEPTRIRVAEVTDVRPDEIIYDIGPKSILGYAQAIKPAKTLVWNGPLGKFEIKPFATSTLALARVIGGIASGKCFAAVGGGETVDAVRQAGQADYIDHLSTGGGAMLEFLAGKTLPGIAALE